MIDAALNELTAHKGHISGGGHQKKVGEKEQRKKERERERERERARGKGVSECVKERGRGK